MRVLSYGAGIDSTALLLLAIGNHIERPDLVLFADTQAESTSTLRTVLEAERRSEEAGIPFRRVTAGNLMDWETNGSLHAPLHFVHNAETAAKANKRKTSGDKMVKPGVNGMLRRTCTDRFKVAPVRYTTRDAGATAAAPAQMLLGITLDEAAARMGDSHVKYIRHEYPLVDLELTGASCEKLLADVGIEAKKSACVMCPLTNLGRRPLAMADADDRDMAVAYDRSIRNAIPDHPELFVDRDAMAPLSLKPPEDDFTLFSACPSSWC